VKADKKRMEKLMDMVMCPLKLSFGMTRPLCNIESCLEGVNRQAETFSTKTRNELGKTGSAGVKTGSTGLHELN
jgi:hypothetical protein